MTSFGVKLNDNVNFFIGSRGQTSLWTHLELQVISSLTCCLNRIRRLLRLISVWLSDNGFLFFYHSVFLRWSVMTYEVPTTNKQTPIVKEEDCLDSPLQVNHPARLLFFVFVFKKEAVCLLTDGDRKWLSFQALWNYFGKHPLRINWAWQLETKAIRLKPRGAAVISTKGSSVFSIQAERCLSNARYAVDGG